MVFFIFFFLDFKRTIYMQTVDTLIRRCVLQMSHKKDARLMWLNGPSDFFVAPLEKNSGMWGSSSLTGATMLCP